MFTVFSEREGKQYKHSVKALQIIWNKFKQLYVVDRNSIATPSAELTDHVSLVDLIIPFTWMI